MSFEGIFICCKHYDFKDEKTGKNVEGYSVKVYDEKIDDVIKCKSDKMVDKAFGEPIEVNVALNGRYASYSIA